MSSITVEDIDDFLDALSRKPCRGPKSYGKHPEEIPTLSSSTVKKCFTILTSGFETAQQWHYISDCLIYTSCFKFCCCRAARKWRPIRR